MSEKIKVLLVPDFVHWVTGTIARGICLHNPQIDGVICSGAALMQHLENGGELPIEPDVIHFLTELEGLQLQDRFLGRLPVVNTIHHVENWGKLRPLAQADAIQVVAEQWRNYLAHEGVAPEKMVMLQNGINIEKFCPADRAARIAARKERGISEDRFVVGFAGKASSNSSQRKGVDIFEAGIKKLSAQIDNLLVFLVGPGWGELQATLQGLNVACVWAPYMINHDELVKFYWCLDVYWVTSRIEGGPAPLLEAMACETLCVTTPVGVVPELIQHDKNGLVVGFNDSEAFMRETLRAKNSPAHAAQMAQQARLTIKTHCRDCDVAACAQPLYDTAIRNFQKRKITAPAASRRPASRQRTMRKLAATDNALWSAELLHMGARLQSLQLCARAIRGSMFSKFVWQHAFKPQVIFYYRSASHKVKQLVKKVVPLAWHPSAAPLKSNPSSRGKN